MDIKMPQQLFWLLIGAGMGRSFRPAGFSEDETYLHYLFPGSLLMILLFTAIFSTISIIEDRREGFLLSMLVSPAPRIKIPGAVPPSGSVGGAF